ncbi:MAG: PaREP1 family protein [Thermoproteota archaeon]|jgi:hypothetical protein|nr:PaREP1 family protein [Thermoproteota archaeon]
MSGSLSSSQIKLLILKWINEADELLEKGDVVQASEKYYKAAEEAIKLLVKTLNLTNILEKVAKQKVWDSRLLFDAARMISQEIYNIWKNAWYLHVYGFHEMKLSDKEVKLISSNIHRIEDILNTYVP